MPAKKKKDDKTEKEKELELRTQIEKSHIQFLGPIQPRKWPSQYRYIFQPIRDIERLRYDEYCESNSIDEGPLQRMKARVSSLVKEASQCRQRRVNEAMWRAKTEPEILRAFTAQVVCPRCTQRLWISQYHAVPENGATQSHLQKIRADRRRCECDPILRAQPCGQGRAVIFSDLHEEPFRRDRADDFPLLDLPIRRPDRVLALEATADLGTWAAQKSRIKHTPFDEDKKALYPFLVLEAKAEKHSIGFEAIEVQTAFPIRACLKLQCDLQQAYGTEAKPLNPLVWFIANQGDEWRVYASVWLDPKFKVIDLWHGTILSHDSALQLLLITDYICDWARDIYRWDIQRCLANDEEDITYATPTSTIFSTPGPPSDGCQTPRPQSSGGVPVRNLYHDIVNCDVEMQEIHITRKDDGEIVSDTSEGDVDEDGAVVLEFDEDGSNSEEVEREVEEEQEEAEKEEYEVDNRHDEEENECADEEQEVAEKSPTQAIEATESFTHQPLLRYSTGSSCRQPWSSHATVRHSNLVLFLFRHVALPEDVTELKSCLISLFESGDLVQRAQIVFRMLADRRAVTIKVRDIEQIENLWTRVEHQPNTATGEPVSAWLRFSTYVRSNDWQVVRHLQCLTGSQRAIQALASIGGIAWDGSAEKWQGYHVACLVRLTQPLRSFCGVSSLEAALSNTDLTLQQEIGVDGKTRHLIWTKSASQSSDSAETGLLEFEESRGHARTSSKLEALLSTRLPPPHLSPSGNFLRHVRAHGGSLLMKKTETWPVTCPTFCLMVFERSSFPSESCLAEKLSQWLSEGVCTIPGDLPGGDQGILRPNDEAAISFWIDILSGKRRSDSGWPSA